VSPAVFLLGRGDSRTVEVTTTTPASPGDAAGSIVVTSSADGFDDAVGIESNSILVTLRSLVDVNRGGAFRGSITGGNGCPPGQGEVAYHEFNVGPGHNSITANLSLTKDVGNVVGVYLVNPDGVAVGFGQNDVGGPDGLAATAFTHDPMRAPGPSSWILQFVGDLPPYATTTGDEVAALPYSYKLK
jgi:hypothetical protein